GVDIGFLGILRWIGIEDIITRIYNKFGVKLTSRFLSWADIQALELTRGHVKIKKEQTKLDKIRPEDLADYLEQTNVENIKGVLKVLSRKKAAEVINNLNLNYQTALFKQLESEEAAKIVHLMDPEEAADILATLSKKKREKIYGMLSDATFNEINYLITMSKTPIGNLLTTEFVSVAPDQRVKEIISKIKSETGDFNALSYVYVVNKEKQLVGVFDLHQLLLQNAETPIYKFMTQNLTVIYLTTPVQVALQKLIKYKLFALPVVDKDKHLLGVVMFDDISSSIKPNG
ncbi:MAG: CBS domain-containing protein, partial [Patescibacteria group bacterium]